MPMRKAHEDTSQRRRECDIAEQRKLAGPGKKERIDREDEFKRDLSVFVYEKTPAFFRDT